ncbi:hypothetical protein FPV67DRAFT_643674 [Lyophyllum atratum]|nr:hypothetical protein FPV67DRAFT_643674 [Lyophyllum atratum]
MVRCHAEGLTFLHKHKIAHGDISHGNVLINHFARASWDHENPFRIRLRSEGHLTYALFDFDLSTKFPESCSLEECRLPYRKSWQGTPGCVPLDTCQGEFDFDPFAWDVGALGLLLCMEYGHMIPDVPMLAPFLDSIVTRNVAQRFTAAQALQFLEDEVYPRTPRGQLQVRFRPRAFDSRDRWAGLDANFCEQWAAYREPPLPRSTKLIRLMCRYRWVLCTVAWVRRSIHLTRETISTFLHY